MQPVGLLGDLNCGSGAGRSRHSPRLQQQQQQRRTCKTGQGNLTRGAHTSAHNLRVSLTHQTQTTLPKPTRCQRCLAAHKPAPESITEHANSS